MDPYILILAIIGFAAFTMAWMPTLTKRTQISYSIIYVLAGIIIYKLFGSFLPSPLPQFNRTETLHLTELVVIISLMGTGIKIDRPFRWKTWSSPLKLVSIAMLLSIAGASLLGYTVLELDLATAILLGAVLAPTDPVLAADVQVGPPNEKLKSETKFSLTAEAGLNDGMAFPFTWLAITLALMSKGSGDSLLEWFAVDFLYKIVAGLIAGFLMGKGCGYLVFTASKKYKFLKTRDGFLAISLTFLVYGITELLQGYGFIAVFVSAITLRHYEKGHAYHEHLHSFTDQTERLLVTILLILFGGALVSGVLDALSWRIVLFSLVFLFFIRPLAAFVSLVSSRMQIKEKLAISFFGIRGMGSVFYLAFAMKQFEFKRENELWTVVAFTILISIIIHGLTATSIMNHLKANTKNEKIPE